MKYLLIALLKAYRLVISPLYGNVCRYYPSCSAYSLRAVETHGAVRGSWLTVRRLARCHPWAAGGYDPVPDTPEGIAWVAEQAARPPTNPAGDGHRAPTHHSPRTGPAGTTDHSAVTGHPEVTRH